MREPAQSSDAATASVPAVILCGGLGTRLRSAVPQLPKVLAPIGDKPFLDYVLLDLAAAGFRDVVLCLGYKAEIVREAYEHRAVDKLRISYSCESSPLGTGGALRYASRLIHSEVFLLLNGDSLLELDYAGFLKAHARSGALVTMALATSDQPGRYGTVHVAANGEVTNFKEKSDAGGSTLINGGVYAMNRDVMKRIRPSDEPVSLERDILPKLVGHGLFGFVADSFFIDIGVPADYERAQMLLPRRVPLACSHSR